MASLPTGTVTFLFTDIEGSTRLLQQLGDHYADVLAEYRRLLRSVSQENGGQEVDTEGDSFFIAFPRAKDALGAAVEAQRSIVSTQWPKAVSVRVRMGLHTGEPRRAETGYSGMDVHRAARICAAGHGGQILLSETTRALIAEDLPREVTLRDLGEHSLKDLAYPQHLFQVVAASLPADFPPLRSLEVLPNNLPPQLTSFIGRERDMVDIKRLLATTRLVTLTGAGGSGKTRLAFQVAADVFEEYLNGVWVVELAALSDPDLVPNAVSSALDVPEQPGRPILATLADALRHRTVLLLLDNCEHLLPACAHLAETLLRACPHLRILATSREALGVEGETIYRVPSMSLPEAKSLPLERLVEFEAVRLFVDRARAALPSFVVTAKNARQVATICRQLDGIPLAIELAAPRVKALSVDHIAERLHDRFRLLASGRRTALPRHQTLRAAIDWSYDLLSEPERVLLRRLSVFAGGFTLEAAEAVHQRQGTNRGEVVDLLTHLVEKSLVIFQEQNGRYGLLETVRQYGWEKLLDSEEEREVRGKHRDWYLGLAEQSSTELVGLGMGRESHVWLERLGTEHDNLRGVLEWSKTEPGGGEVGLRLAAALWRFWFLRGYWMEGRGWLEAALARSGGAPVPALSRVLRGAAWLAWHQGDYGRSVALAEQGLVLGRESGTREVVTWSLHILGLMARHQGDYGRATALFEESLALGRQLEDKWWMSDELAQLGNVANDQGDHERAAALYTKGLTLAREVGEKWLIAFSLLNLGVVVLDEGDHGRAAALYTEGLNLVREVGERGFVTLGYLAGLATLACNQGDYRRAATLFGVVEASHEALGRHRSPTAQAKHDQRVASARAGLGEATFAAAWAKGRAMTLEEAIEYALSDA